MKTNQLAGCGREIGVDNEGLSRCGRHSSACTGSKPCTLASSGWQTSDSRAWWMILQETEPDEAAKEPRQQPGQPRLLIWATRAEGCTISAAAGCHAHQEGLGGGLRSRLLAERPSKLAETVRRHRSCPRCVRGKGSKAFQGWGAVAGAFCILIEQCDPAGGSRCSSVGAACSGAVSVTASTTVPHSSSSACPPTTTGLRRIQPLSAASSPWRGPGSQALIRREGCHRRRQARQHPPVLRRWR